MTVTVTQNPRWLVPEVVQSSAMDCGPAALKALLEGFGISASYGRLREACQTTVDGTSINALEEAAVQLGLDAEQVMIPFDHLTLHEANLLPAIVLLWSPGKLIHFVIAWRRHGPVVQVMDPSTGRRWPSVRKFREQLYVHETDIPGSDWFDWASSDDFLKPLDRRLRALGMTQSESSRVLEQIVQRPGWRPLAGLDAAVRMASDLLTGGGLRASTAKHIVHALVDAAADQEDLFETTVPEHYWSARAASRQTDVEYVRMRGAVVVTVRGRGAGDRIAAGGPDAVTSPPPELVAALAEPSSRPGRDLLRLVRAGGAAAATSLLVAAVVGAAAVLVEALLFRAVIDLDATRLLDDQRWIAIGAVWSFVVLMFALDLSLMFGVLRMGRLLEARLRLSLLQKIPRLGDRYFHSRLTSDMADRSHSIHSIRLLPWLGSRFVQALTELVCTVGGILWLDPESGVLAISTSVAVVALPFSIQPLLAERDLRFRAHAAALTRIVLDASLGLLPVRAHTAERAVRRQHESLLTEWGRAGLGLHAIERTLGVLQNVVGFGGAAWALWSVVGRTGAESMLLLLAYWFLRLPLLGQELTAAMRQYPLRRNVMLRLLEPLSAPAVGADLSTAGSEASSTQTDPAPGVALTLEHVTVQASGLTILDDVSVHVPAGAHVAIVGPSGSGKSTLVGIFLGWSTGTGRVLVDDVPLDHVRTTRLRRETAWVDPAVQLWNRSLLENVRYGLGPDSGPPLSQAAECGGLDRVIERLPDGVSTVLGEGGGLLSGGEGQRTRLTRALLRPGVRLAILDEPFRGLDRKSRQNLLERAREHWAQATLLCITHDVSETLAFGRVLVVDGGRVCEDAHPRDLAARADSRYRALLDAEQSVQRESWSDPRWQRIWLQDGRLEAR